MNSNTGNTFFTFITTSLFVLFFFFPACKKSNVVDPIPNVPVNITIYLNLPQYTALNSTGNSVYINGGVKGIIVHRRAQNEFVAYDRACPFDHTAAGALLELDSSLITTVDLHCGSKFSLYEGSILSGPATSPMKPYNSNFDSGNNTVYISN